MQSRISDVSGFLGLRIGFKIPILYNSELKACFIIFIGRADVDTVLVQVPEVSDYSIMEINADKALPQIDSRFAGKTKYTVIGIEDDVRKLKVRENISGQTLLLPEGTLICPAFKSYIKSAYKALKLNKKCPKVGDILECISVYPLKFVNTSDGN